MLSLHSADWSPRTLTIRFQIRVSCIQAVISQFAAYYFLDISLLFVLLHRYLLQGLTTILSSVFVATNTWVLSGWRRCLLSYSNSDLVVKKTIKIVPLFSDTQETTHYWPGTMQEHQDRVPESELHRPHPPTWTLLQSLSRIGRHE